VEVHIPATIPSEAYILLSWFEDPLIPCSFPPEHWRSRCMASLN
jgi:hypothetical protein